MSLELVKEVVKLNRLIGEESAQTMIENDIIVPDVNPDIGRILLCDGDVYVKRSEVMKDKVAVDGLVVYKILYVSDPEGRIKSIQTGGNFSYDLEISDAQQGMSAKVTCDLEHIQASIVNGRKVNTKAILRVRGKITEEAEHDIVNHLIGDEEVQVLRENISLNTYLGCVQTEFDIRESLEVPTGKPTVKEILRQDVKITEKDFKIEDGKVLVKGEMNVSTLYVGDDEEESLQFMEGGIPFSEWIELSGADDSTQCEVEVAVANADFEITEDSDGELRVLKSDISIHTVVHGYQRKTLDMISDAYSPEMRISLEKESIRTEEVLAVSKNQITLKELVLLESECPEVSEVLNVLSSPGISECRIYEDKIVIEGVVRNNMLYVTDHRELPLYCHVAEVPFRHEVDVKGLRAGMMPTIGVDMDHCSYSMVAGNQIELRLVIGIDLKISYPQVLPLVVKVVEQLQDDCKMSAQPSITIYFSQPGDNLWKIAKKYCTTMDNIKKVNHGVDFEHVLPGQQIIIPRRA